EAKLDRLVELVPIHYYENNHSEIVVSLNGRSLVDKDYFNPIEIRMNQKGHGEIHYSDTGEKIQLDNKGELAGYKQARDQELVVYMNRLNTLVLTMAEKVNEIHEKGYGLDGSTGNKFFVFSDDPNTTITLGDNPAAIIKVNPELNDYNK